MIQRLTTLVAPTLTVASPVAVPALACEESAAAWLDRAEPETPVAIVTTRRVAEQPDSVALGLTPPHQRGRRASLRRRRVVACWRLALQLTRPAVFEPGWKLFVQNPSGRPRVVRASSHAPTWMQLLAPLRVQGMVPGFGRSVPRRRLQRRSPALAVAACMVPGMLVIGVPRRR